MASDPVDIHEGVPREPVDALYGAPLEEFTARRDGLAKELGSAGQRAAGAWVKALRKPSAAAWVVNQLTRMQGREAKRMLDAGEKLRAAHEELLAGGEGADRLRQASEQEREAVRALLSHAPALLDGDGHAPSRATLDRVAETLHAVVLDDATRAAFAAGRLTREARTAGPGPFGPGDPAAPRRPRVSGARAERKGAHGKGTGGGREGRPRRSEERTRARAALDEAKALQRSRRRAVTEAQRAVTQARREVERAQRRLEQATGVLEAARAVEAEAQSLVESARTFADGIG